MVKTYGNYHGTLKHHRVWTSVFKSKLQMCQNKIIRFVHSMGPRDSGNNIILANMSLLNVENRNDQ
jgi:hypothetical protein